MYARFSSHLLCIFALMMLAFMWGCEEKTTTSQIAEGIIEYKATPVNPKSSLSMMFPDKMTVKFRNDYTLAELDAGVGAMHIAFLSDPNKKTFTNMVSFLDKKAAVLDSSEIRTRNYYLPDYSVSETKETKKIAGYNCQKAILKFADKSPDMEVWYTRELQVNKPNWTNAFYKIDGVLMDYRLRKFGLELHFTANSVMPAKIDSAVFTVPAEYKMISEDELDQSLQGFF
ncbi:MAG: DUF4412 domain-containing protein [Bacteroidetes bacterium]|nr:DUF4412 domain-containing protein [Bacteroidota bacterium]